MRIDPSFAELYRAEFDTVFRAVGALCRDRDVAEEATQEAFARALERWRRLRGKPWAAGWVTTTAMNVARRMLRKRPALHRGAETEDTDETIDLWRGVRELPERQQQAVILFYVLDLSVTEVAEAMRCSTGSVKTHLHRARAWLRSTLQEAHDDR